MKRLRHVAPLAAACVAVLAIAACSSSGSDADTGDPSGGHSTASSGKQLVIGWADPKADQPVFQTFTDALNAAAGREGSKIITLDGQGSPSTQVSNIQTFITDHVDAIIVFPDDATGLIPTLTKAQNAGIKIIGFNAILPSAPGATPDVPAPYATDLDFGYVDGPATAGKFVAQQLKGKGNVLGIKFPVPVPALNAMLASYEKSVTDGNPGIHWLGTVPDGDDGIAGGRQAVSEALTRFHNDIQAVMGDTDLGAIGAAQALTAAGIKDAVVVGQQGNQTGIDAVKSGLIQGDLDVQPYVAAVWAYAAAKDLVHGTTVPKFIRLPNRFITKGNVDSYVNWKDGVSAIKSGKTSLDVTFPAS